MDSKRGIRRGPYKNVETFKKYFCSNCNKCYKRKAILLHHIRTKHLNYYAPCPVCCKRFISISMCNRHLKKIHKTSNELYQICFKSNVDTIPKSNDVTCIKETYKVKENSKFGKYIIANCDIDVGQTVFKTSAFASIEYLSSVQNACFKCGKSWKQTFMKCPHCICVWFCSERCAKNKIHMAKCNKIFDSADCKIVRIITEIVRVASEMSLNLKAFTELSAGVLNSKSKSIQYLQPFSKYVEMLSLKANPKVEHIGIAKRAVECIRKILNISSEDFRTFDRTLFYLAYQHATTIEVNSFSYEVSCDNGVSIHFSMHDIISRLNHSCAPNLFYITDENNIAHCITVRPIIKGEQLFVSYLGEMDFESKKERQDYLDETWAFKCKCDKCIPTEDQSKSIAEDQSFKYIKQHFKDLPLKNRQRMRKECLTWLRKYGHSWTECVDYVVKCLSLLIKTEQ